MFVCMRSDPGSELYVEMIILDKWIFTQGNKSWFGQENYSSEGRKHFLDMCCESKSLSCEETKELTFCLGSNWEELTF